MRAHDAFRRDLMTRASSRLQAAAPPRPRLSQPSTWTVAHRGWLARQQFDQPASELAYADAAGRRRRPDALARAALAEQLSQLATDERWWPTVARLRAFRGIDTLTALALHLELAATGSASSARRALGAWLGLTPSLQQSGESSPHGIDHQDRLRRSPAGCWSRRPGTTAARRGSARPWPTARPASPTTSCRSPTAPSSACTASTRRMRARGKPANVIVVAVARELACFLWAAATAD